MDNDTIQANDKTETEPLTPVVFRMMRKGYGGEVIALFPAEPFDRFGDLVTCYVHVGQHGSANYHDIVWKSRLATPEEYAALKAELESEPYNYRLKVYRRETPQMRKARREQVEQWRRANG